jgi:hypothetical protein
VLSPADVTACLVTRGDQPDAIARISSTLVFDDVIVWDNSVREDWRCAGRYMAALEASTDVVYFQDDDVTVPPDTQQALADAWEPGVCVANWAHGDTPDGYDDLPLVGAGAIVEARLCWDAIARYHARYPLNDAFAYEADFIVGALYPAYKHLRLPFEIDAEVAQHPSRLCNQPWQPDLKLAMTNRGRDLARQVVAA